MAQPLLRLGALAVALAALALLLLPAAHVPPPAPAPVAEQRLPLAAPVAVAQIAPLFAEDAPGTMAEAGDDRPELIGMAGRLPDDVEVLVRLPDGSSRSLARGDSVRGWTLLSATLEGAIFEKGGERIVLALEPE